SPTITIIRVPANPATATTSLHDALPISPKHEAFVIQGGVNYDVLAWPNGDPSPARKVLAQVMSYEYLFQALREKGGANGAGMLRSEEHTSELQSRFALVCRLLLEKNKTH